MPISLESLLPAGRVGFVLSEVQEGIVGDLAPWPQLADAAKKVGLVENACRIADAARERKAPVMHCVVQNLPDMFGQNTNARLFGNARKRADNAVDPRYWNPMPGLRKDGDVTLHRHHGMSPFADSQLDSLLRNSGVTTVILSGVSLAFGIIGGTMDAVNRSYQVIIPSDAVAGFPEEYCQDVMKNTLNMLATIVPTEEILKAWPK